MQPWWRLNSMSTDNQLSRNMRIGALVGASLLILMLILFFIGSEQRIFSRKNDYQVRLDTVSGLAEGNPVKLSGVTIGAVKEIWLPRDARQGEVKIALSIERKYSERIRTDSRARLKKLGLLTGDSYIDITPGAPNLPVLPAGSLIPAQRQTNVDQLISSGEDLVDNFVQISYSLKNILGRVDRGEGLLGELTSQPDTKQRLTDTLLVTLNKTNALLQQVESGKGLVGKLVYDESYGTQLTASLDSSIRSLETIMANVQGSFESGTGALPALLNDVQTRDKAVALVDNLHTTSANLVAVSQSMQTGEGLVPRLLHDRDYADETLREFSLLVSELRGMASKLNRGEGTAGKLIADPAVYESINDILIGINESKMLRWLIRNRQGKGIEKRYNDATRDPRPVTKEVASPSPQPVPPKSTIAPVNEEPPPVVPQVSPQDAPAPMESPTPEAPVEQGQPDGTTGSSGEVPTDASTETAPAPQPTPEHLR